MCTALEGSVENLEILQNSIPRAWAGLEPFKGRTEEASGNKLSLYPYIGAFEIYHRDTLLYSKLSCRLWPNCKAVAKKIASYFQDVKDNGDANKYAINYKHPAKNISKIYKEE